MDISKYLENLRNDLKDVSSELDSGTQKVVDLAGDEKKIGELIETINDENQSSEKKQEALQLLNTISIFSPVLPTKMPEFVNALRGLTNTDNPALRLQAFGSLASMKDEYVQEKLLEILQSGAKEIDKAIPTHNAIAMLGFDEKALDHGILKDIIQNPPDTKSLVQALRHIEVDENSLDTLIDVMENHSLPIQARSLVPELIHQIDPKAFVNSAKKIIEDQGANADIVPFLERELPNITEEEAEGLMDMLKDKLDDAKDFLSDLWDDVTGNDDDDKK